MLFLFLVSRSGQPHVVLRIKILIRIHQGILIIVIIINIPTLGFFLIIHLTDEINTNVHVDTFSKIFLKQGRNVDNVMTADSRGQCRADKNILV